MIWDIKTWNASWTKTNEKHVESIATQRKKEFRVLQNASVRIALKTGPANGRLLKEIPAKCNALSLRDVSINKQIFYLFNMFYL